MAISAGDPSRLKRVFCTHCDQPLDISPRAMSVSCPHCRRRVVTEEMKIKSYRAASLLATCGKVEVMKRGHVVAKMKVDELIVRGKVVGDVRARTKVTVRKTGKLHGDIRTPNLKVEFGAEVVGDCYIAPDAEEPGQSSE